MITECEREDDEASAMAEAGSGRHRRSLLRAAAGGMVLAASWLILPGWLAETGAREGALDGAKGGRRGKNRRGRHKKRTHGDKKAKQKDQDKPPGDGLGYKNIEFQFEVTGGRSVDITSYDFQELFPFSGWLVGNVQATFAPGSSGTARNLDRRAALLIDKHLWIKAVNPLFPPWANPEVHLGHGGDFKQGNFETGTTVAISVLAVGSWSYKLEIDGYAIQAIRLKDNDDKWTKVFKVMIQSPSA